jgi:hypothetical protein
MKLNLATQRQLEVEEGKGRKNQGRITQLRKKVEEGEGKADALEKLIKEVFDGYVQLSAPHPSSQY